MLEEAVKIDDGIKWDKNGKYKRLENEYNVLEKKINDFVDHISYIPKYIS
jgi:hypothetical protein